MQDAEETGIAGQPVMVGIPGVRVTLYDDNNQPISSTVTGPNGRYLFPALPAGSYAIGIDPPAGYVATTAHRSYHSDTDIFDSDLDPVTLRTITVTLMAGERNMTLDVGLHLRRVQAGSIGNGVWLDLDRNGQWDANEVGVPGVDVRLIDSAGSTFPLTSTARSPGGTSRQRTAFIGTSASSQSMLAKRSKCGMCRSSATGSTRKAPHR